ncbi:DUF4149 domain-containing protein [Oxalicibacterium solurbis]|uniref:TMEM205-like domain-containing protein n=1 Tax=Oxalicibacterium solurbis TaxID=69280 RepID=A0A8J3AZN6_9BURK|nr:DUF4149 domain-containing protein [Oxalicibacterium solurbis]GGI54456.1 hypothetical protein GCM10011430_16300 [Oxalicibacterium solurbis]
MLTRCRLLIAVLWVGALWTVGFIVAPTLFATLADKALAGTIAGSLFRVMAWMSIVCAVLLLVLRKNMDAGHARAALWLILGMVACTLVGYFALQPQMAELRLILHGAVDAGQLADAKKQFGILHAVSTGFYLVQSILGALLVLRMR